jgi:hypothetical protein
MRLLIIFNNWNLKMYEMLGNQCFMARNYLGNATVFQIVLKKDPTNIKAKNLINSFAQFGKYTKATDLFSNFIAENVDRIIETDSITDDCLNPELVINSNI